MGHLDDVYSVEDVAKLLGVPTSKVYALLRQDMRSGPVDRNLPGAWQEAGVYNREWFIPASAVDHYQQMHQPPVDELVDAGDLEPDVDDMPILKWFGL